MFTGIDPKIERIEVWNEEETEKELCTFVFFKFDRMYVILNSENKITEIVKQPIVLGRKFKTYKPTSKVPEIIAAINKTKELLNIA